MTTTTAAVPYKAPEDVTLLHTIHAVAVEVTQFGSAHENVLRGSYAFLTQQDNPEYGYFRWILFVMKEGLGYESIGALSILHAQRIMSFEPGYMDLLREDLNQLQQLLTQNTGSRDAIKAIRRWIVERAHSTCAISISLHDFIFTLIQTDNTAPLPTPAETFERILYTLYTINDVFYNQKHAKMLGPYTTSIMSLEDTANSSINIAAIMFPYLPAIFQYANTVLQSEAQREKMLRLATLWSEKGFITVANSETLKATLVTPQNPHLAPLNVPVRSKLLSPMLGRDLLDEHKRSLGLLPPMVQTQHQHQQPTVVVATSQAVDNSSEQYRCQQVQHVQQQPAQYFQAYQGYQQAIDLPPPPPLPPSVVPAAQHNTYAPYYQYQYQPPPPPPRFVPHQACYPQAGYVQPSSAFVAPRPSSLPPKPPSSDLKRSWDDTLIDQSSSNKKLQHVDLMTVPVGRMVTIIKAAMMMSSPSFKPYSAIDASAVNVNMPGVEASGGIPEKIAECYRQLEEA